MLLAAREIVEARKLMRSRGSSRIRNDGPNPDDPGSRPSNQPDFPILPDPANEVRHRLCGPTDVAKAGDTAVVDAKNSTSRIVSHTNPKRQRGFRQHSPRWRFGLVSGILAHARIRVFAPRVFNPVAVRERRL